MKLLIIELKISGLKVLTYSNIVAEALCVLDIVYLEMLLQHYSDFEIPSSFISHPCLLPLELVACLT